MEINETLEKVKARGDADFTANDFETMPYLVAITKVCRTHLFTSIKEGEIHLVPAQEILRNNPIAIDIVRAPIEDDVLPLTKPIVGISGRVYAELPIPRGTSVAVSTIGYNMCVSRRPLPTFRQRYHIIVFMPGTRVCGVQTLTNSDRSGGSK